MLALNLPLRAFLTCVSTLVLLACAQPSFDWSANLLPPPNLLSVSGQDKPDATASLRVIVQFKEPFAGNDASVLQAMQAQIGGQLLFLSAVSADTHVYSLQLTPGLDAEQALQRLATAPGVMRVERDQTAKAH